MTNISQTMKVVFYHRRPERLHFSIERLFDEVRAALPSYVSAEVVKSRYLSRGIWRRIYNILEAVFRQGDVNHITGDVHFLALLLSREKTLLTIADLVTVHRLSGIQRFLFLTFWYKLPIHRSAIVTVISQFTKEELLCHVRIARDKVRVVHCCIPGTFLPFAREFNAIKPIILQMGTRSNKNLKRVVEALAGIPCHLRIIGPLEPQHILTLATCGVEYSSAEELTDEQVLDEYRRCDILVFVSTFEGFGLPIIEAQAIGRPVVTSNIMSMPEVAGSGAYLADPFDVESIRQGILKVIAEPRYREKLVQLGFENIERFSPQAIAQQYLDIYNELYKK